MKALKILRKKRRRQDPPSDTETISCTGPYKNHPSRRYNMYRKKAKKNALRIIRQARKSRAKKSAEETVKLEREA